MPDRRESTIRYVPMEVTADGLLKEYNYRDDYRRPSLPSSFESPEAAVTHLRTLPPERRDGLPEQILLLPTIETRWVYGDPETL